MSAAARASSSMRSISAFTLLARSSTLWVASSAAWTRSSASRSAFSRVSRARSLASSTIRRASALGAVGDLGGAALGGLDDAADLLGGLGCERGRAALGLALELLDGLGDLAQVAVDLLRVVATPGGREVVALDEVTVQFHGSDLP